MWDPDLDLQPRVAIALSSPRERWPRRCCGNRPIGSFVIAGIARIYNPVVRQAEFAGNFPYGRDLGDPAREDVQESRPSTGSVEKTMLVRAPFCWSKASREAISSSGFVFGCVIKGYLELSCLSSSCNALSLWFSAISRRNLLASRSPKHPAYHRRIRPISAITALHPPVENGTHVTGQEAGLRQPEGPHSF